MALGSVLRTWAASAAAAPCRLGASTAKCACGADISAAKVVPAMANAAVVGGSPSGEWVCCLGAALWESRGIAMISLDEIRPAEERMFNEIMEGLSGLKIPWRVRHGSLSGRLHLGRSCFNFVIGRKDHTPIQAHYEGSLGMNWRDVYELVHTGRPGAPPSRWRSVAIVSYGTSSKESLLYGEYSFSDTSSMKVVMRRIRDKFLDLKEEFIVRYRNYESIAADFVEISQEVRRISIFPSELSMIAVASMILLGDRQRAKEIIPRHTAWLSREYGEYSVKLFNEGLENMRSRGVL